jgi:two-component system, OmpR family, phosphate regulon response regulator PhoB
MVTILVVDDEEPVRQLLAGIFADRGYRSLQAHNGRHALEVLQTESADLVLTDMMMPQLTGADLCRRLKTGPETRSIPVILMSAAGRGVADGTGADAYLDKPFQLDEVEALVEEWLKRAPG